MKILKKNPPENLEIPLPKRFQVKDYGIETTTKGMLEWQNSVDSWMKKSKNYWISSTKPNGNPHAVPVWGIWRNNIIYFGGGKKTQKFVNMDHNQNIVVHSESGQKCVILEGQVFEIPTDLQDILDDEYEKKYKIRHGPPILWLEPKKVLVWDMDDFKNTPTKFLF